VGFAFITNGQTSLPFASVKWWLHQVDKIELSTLAWVPVSVVTSWGPLVIMFSLTFPPMEPDAGHQATATRH
jgi:hypothetical protein